MILIITLLFSYLSVSDVNGAIYGEDDRQLIYSHSNEFISKASQSIAAKLREKPKHIIGHLYQVTSKPLNSHIKNLCPTERFFQVETYSNCTGF